jgi:hypothetical protein
MGLSGKASAGRKQARRNRREDRQRARAAAIGWNAATFRAERRHARQTITFKYALAFSRRR